MTTKKGFLFFGVLLISTLGRSDSRSSSPFEIRSGPGQTSLLEIFSSEGCSSCPPAEAWLNKLQDSSALWKEVVPICFHVDYWDYLGWTDPLGSREFSERQRSYHGDGKIASVYTPGFVLNGLEWRGWFEGKPFPAPSANKPGVLVVKQVSSSDFQVQFNPSDRSIPTWDLHAVLLGMDIVSKVRAGENQGKTLVHNFVVLAHQTSPLIPNDAGFRARLRFDRALNHFSQKSALAVWVVTPDGARPVQAVGGLLSD